MVYKKLLILTTTILVIPALFLILHTTLERDFIIQSAFAQNTSANDGNNISNIANTSSSNTTTQTKDVEYNVYSNSTLGIKIKVPSTWLYKVENSQVLFLSPTENKSINGNVSSGYTTVSTAGIGIENAPPTSNQTQLTQLAINAVKGSLVDFHSDNSNTTTLAGSPANEIVYSGKTLAGNDAKGLIIWKVQNTKLYSFTYSAVTSGKFPAAAGEFERHLPIVKQMIDSFEISNYAR